MRWAAEHRFPRYDLSQPGREPPMLYAALAGRAIRGAITMGLV